MIKQRKRVEKKQYVEPQIGKPPGAYDNISP